MGDGPTSSPTVTASGFMMSSSAPPPEDPPLESASSSAKDSTPPRHETSPPRDQSSLMLRAAWMLEGDDRSEAHADAAWHRANDNLIPPRVSLPPSSTGFFDEEYVQGRRTVTPPPAIPNESSAITAVAAGPATDAIALIEPGRLSNPVQVIDVDFESRQEVDRVHTRIMGMLAMGRWLPDFKAHHIPSQIRDPELHRQLHELLLAQNRLEADLENMMNDVAADKTSLDPTRDFEAEYERMNSAYDETNRTMFLLYAELLPNPAANYWRTGNCSHSLCS